MSIKRLFIFITFVFNYMAFGQYNLVINEIMADNETIIIDEDGDYSDWIELYNNGNTIVNLAGLFITDDSLNLSKWAFPAIELKPDSFLLLFASGKNKINEPFYHTNFKIKSDGEVLIMSDSLGNLIDYFSPIPLDEDIAYGRRPDGTDHFYFFDLPTPGSTNNFSNSLSCSHERGYYAEPFLLTINSDDTSSTIYYTLDGSIPNLSSEQYTEPLWINYRYDDPNTISEIPTTPDSTYISSYYWLPPDRLVDKATVLRIRSYHNFEPTSKIYSYTFFADSTIFNKYTIPVVSLITDPKNLFNYDTGIYVPGIHWDPEDPQWTGNYYQKSDEWERDVHIEFFEQSGEVGFCQDAGIKIHGKLTRRRSQKSLKLFSRTKYGKKYFDYTLFPQREFDQYKHFIIKNSFGCLQGTIIKDVMTHDLIRPLGLEISEYQPVIVYINGEYWGFQTIREDQDENYLSSLYNINEESINIIENQKHAKFGSNENYLELLEFIENHDLAIPSNYNYVATKIDIDNFIDYQISEIYLKNYDWPGSNIEFWQSGELDNKWRWIFFDLDFAYGDYNYNMMEHVTLEGGTSWPNPDWSTLLLRNFLKNESFENLFIERFAELLNTLFQPDTIISKIQKFTDLFEPEIDNFISRYGYPASKSEWLSTIDLNLTNFAKKRPCTMQDHIMDFFDLTEFGFRCDTTIDDSTKVKIYKLYPNPNNGRLNILLDSSGLIDIQIFNNMGLSVFQRRYEVEHDYNELRLDLTHLKSGIYMMHFKQNSFLASEKIIICK